jgi:serine/threonine protein kinase
LACPFLRYNLIVHGFCTKPCFCMVTEFCERGSLMFGTHCQWPLPNSLICSSFLIFSFSLLLNLLFDFLLSLSLSLSLSLPRSSLPPLSSSTHLNLLSDVISAVFSPIQNVGVDSPTCRFEAIFTVCCLCSDECPEDLVRGVLYLHEWVPPIVHRDIKSANLFIDARSLSLSFFSFLSPLFSELSLSLSPLFYIF